MQGSQALMNIFYDNKPNADFEPGCKRSKVIRDNAIACRFYYHAGIEGRRYDVCLGLLSKEFYLSSLVIAQRLMTQQALLKQLHSENTTSKDLEKLFPFFIWK